MFAPFPPHRFQLAMIDPPWTWRPWSPKGNDRAPSYAQLVLDELKALPMDDLLAKDAMVALWVIDSCLPQAMQLLDAWGLRFSSVGFYWAKRTKNDTGWHFGNGKLTRANCEQCWIARRGKGLPVMSHSVRRLIVSPVREHSRKPDEARAGLERLFGDVSRIELFARERAPGWSGWGLDYPPS